MHLSSSRAYCYFIAPKVEVTIHGLGGIIRIASSENSFGNIRWFLKLKSAGSYLFGFWQNLIDLAGSESSKTETTGLRRKEGSYINKSLLTLGTVWLSLWLLIYHNMWLRCLYQLWDARTRDCCVPSYAFVPWNLRENVAGNSKTEWGKGFPYTLPGFQAHTSAAIFFEWSWTDIGTHCTLVWTYSRTIVTILAFI